MTNSHIRATTINATIACAVAFSSLVVASPAAADQIRNDQWHLAALHIGQAQQLAPNLGQDVLIGVMDTGVDGNHPDLSGNILPGLDLVGTGNGWQDDDGHGTGMAGLAVAHGHGDGHGDGALGVAPKAKVIPVRVGVKDDPAAILNNTAHVDWAKGIGFLVDHGVKIISISYSAPQDDATQNAIKAAKARGVIVIMSAGNTSHQAFTDGGAINADLVVGASGKDGQLDPITVEPAPFIPITILAPGRDVVSTSTAAKYRIGTGTSPSAPLVAGVAALIWSQNPQLSKADVLWRLTSTAHDIGAHGYDTKTGWGVVDPVAAVGTTVGRSPGAGQPSFTQTCAEKWMDPQNACLPKELRHTPTDRPAAGAAGDSVGVAGVLVVAALAVTVGVGLWLLRAHRRRHDTDS